MKIGAAKDGGAVLRFDRPEGELLIRLFTDTSDAMRPDVLDADDPVLQRLFPSAYVDDPEAEKAFRELTEASLRDERIERAEQCAADVAGAPQRRRGLEVVLDAEGGQRWMRALNDIRLALGTRLEITEDDPAAFDPGDPEAGTRLAYAYLTGVQDSLVHALMR